MKKILILAGRYLPGYKDGGPVRTLINLTDLLGDEYDFRLVVLDRDHGDIEPYPNIKVNDWNQVGKAKVWYYAPGDMNKRLIRKLAKDVDLIYTCGFYDGYGYKTLQLHKQNKLCGKPVVVASMGTFSEGALSHKSFKKKVFIGLCKLFGLFKNIIWSVTSTYEEEDLKRVIGKSAKCIIAEDPPRVTVNNAYKEYSPQGMLRVVFISRISPQKNLLYAVKILERIESDVVFDIYGPLEDKEYWGECQERLKQLPSNISWKYCGEVPTEDVPSVFAKYDAFLFPTKGENYGHVIFEALASGCIPIISDTTPWDNLMQNHAGFSFNLLEEKKFSQTLKKLNEMTAKDKQEWGTQGINLAKIKIAQTKENTGYRKIFGE